MTHSDRLEMLGEIIEIFERFLDERGIIIENEEKNEDAYASNIYGCDYGDMESEIESILIENGLLEEEVEAV